MALNGMRFDVDLQADGLRIYAKLAQETIGALDAREKAGKGRQLSITAIYVVPRWREQGVASAMLECFRKHAACPAIGSPSKSGI